MQPTTLTGSLPRRAMSSLVMAALFSGFSALTGSAALAHEHPSIFNHSPSPYHPGGTIDVVRAKMRAQFAPGSCLRGTFISAATTALEINAVRVRPDAAFWFHNATPRGWNGNPWRIDRVGTHNMVRNLKPALQVAVLTRVGDTADFQLVYTGAQLAREFGYPLCN